MISFSQHSKPITHEGNVIDFGGYFIYGGHFMNRQCQASDMQIRKYKTSPQATLELDYTNSSRKYTGLFCRLETLLFSCKTDAEFI